MSLQLAVRPDLRGSQRPSLLHLPSFTSSTGREVVELAGMAGLALDPWQQFVLDNAMGEDVDGLWAAREVGVEVARQNGKGSILEARELAGLFLLGEELIIHTAHEFATSLEAYRRLRSLIRDTPELHAQVAKNGYKNSHGDEGIDLRNGQRIRFKTRTKGGGRGFSCDCLILDEAMVLPEAMHGALFPTVSAKPNAQVWYTGSAVDQENMEHGRVFSRLRERAQGQKDPSLAFFGWEATDCGPEHVGDAATDPELWARANPGLGIRITVEHVEREQRSMDPRTFAVERLGVGDWPALGVTGNDGIPYEAWVAATDEASALVDPVTFAIDVRPNRSMSSICAAGRRADGLLHVEVVEHRPGTGWLVRRVVELMGKHDSGPVIYDQAGPAASLAIALEQEGVPVQAVTAQEHARACGMIFDAVDQQTLRHRGTPELAAAVKGAVKRPLGDAWAWSRKGSSVDISPLVACTLALWGLETQSQATPTFEWA